MYIRVERNATRVTGIEAVCGCGPRPRTRPRPRRKHPPTMSHSALSLESHILLTFHSLNYSTVSLFISSDAKEIYK